MPNQTNQGEETPRPEVEPAPQEEEASPEAAAEATKKSVRETAAEAIEGTKNLIKRAKETLAGHLTEKEASRINMDLTEEASHTEAVGGVAEAQVRTAEAEAIAGITETEKAFEEFQQLKSEARFGKENVEKLKAENVLKAEAEGGHSEQLTGAIEVLLKEKTGFWLALDTESKKEETRVIKELTTDLKDYFDYGEGEEAQEKVESACQDIFYAFRAHFTERASQEEIEGRLARLAAPKTVKGKLLKGAGYMAAGFAGTAFLGVGGIIATGALRQLDAAYSRRITQKKLAKYKEKVSKNENDEKEELKKELADLIVSKKRTDLLAEKQGWQAGEQGQYAAENYKEAAMAYLEAHEPDWAEGLEAEEKQEKMEKMAESIATFYAVDDNTEKLNKELGQHTGGKWQQLANLINKKVPLRGLTDPGRGNKFYTGAAATGIGTGLIFAARASKTARRLVMAYAGYKMGGALAEVAAGKLSPERTARESLAALSRLDLSEVTDPKILDNYSKGVAKARAALSETPKTAKNKSAIEAMEKELAQHEFALLNETVLQKSKQSAQDIEIGSALIYGTAEKAAKKEVTTATRKAQAAKVLGRIGGVAVGYIGAEIIEALRGKIQEKLAAKAAGPKKELPLEEFKKLPVEEQEAYLKRGVAPRELEFLKGEKTYLSERERILGELETERPIPLRGKGEISELRIPTGDFGYKGGGSVWEESENQLKALLGNRFEGLSTEEKNILIDDVKDSVVRELGDKVEFSKMTAKQLGEIDWEKHVRGTIKTAPRPGLAMPKVPRPEIPKPIAPEPKAPPALDIETKVSQGIELPKEVGPTPQEIGPMEAPPPPGRAIEGGLAAEAEVPPPKAGLEIIKETELPETKPAQGVETKPWLTRLWEKLKGGERPELEGEGEKPTTAWGEIKEEYIPPEPAPTAETTHVAEEMAEASEAGTASPPTEAQSPTEAPAETPQETPPSSATEQQEVQAPTRPETAEPPAAETAKGTGIETKVKRMGDAFYIERGGETTRLFPARGIELYYDDTGQLYDFSGKPLPFVEGRGYKWPGGENYYNLLEDGRIKMTHELTFKAMEESQIKARPEAAFEELEEELQPPPPEAAEMPTEGTVEFTPQGPDTTIKQDTQIAELLGKAQDQANMGDYDAARKTFDNAYRTAIKNSFADKSVKFTPGQEIRRPLVGDTILKMTPNKTGEVEVSVWDTNQQKEWAHYKCQVGRTPRGTDYEFLKAEVAGKEMAVGAEVAGQIEKEVLDELKNINKTFEEMGIIVDGDETGFDNLVELKENNPGKFKEMKSILADTFKSEGVTEEKIDTLIGKKLALQKSLPLKK